LNLSRFNPHEVSQLSAAILGHSGTAPEILELLNQETEGNVFFLVEVVRALAEYAGGLLSINQGDLPEHVLTGGIQEIVHRRLSNIPNTFQQIMQFAAVLGRELDINLLQYRYHPADIEAWLLEGINAAVLNVSENNWYFAHDKLRNGVLLSIPEDITIELHRLAAEAIEATYPHSADYDDVLLEHWHQAGNLDKEIDYLNKVVQYLVEITANYGRVLTLLDRGLQALPNDDDRRIQLLFWQAQTYQRQGDNKKGKILIQQAYDLAQQNKNQHGIALTLKNIAMVTYYEGNSTLALDYALQSLALYQQLGDEAESATVLNRLGIVHATTGKFEQALDYYQQSLAIRERLGNQHGIAIVLNNLGMLAYYQDDYDLALEYFQKSMMLYESLGEQLYMGTTLGNRTWIYAIRNDEKLHQLLRDALVQAYSVQSSPLTLGILPSYALFCLYQGKIMRSAEIVTLIQNHPSYHGEIKERLNHVLPLLNDVIRSDEMVIAHKNGQTLELYPTVQEIIDELKQQ